MLRQQKAVVELILARPNPETLKVRTQEPNVVGNSVTINIKKHDTPLALFLALASAGNVGLPTTQTQNPLLGTLKPSLGAGFIALHPEHSW